MNLYWEYSARRKTLVDGSKSSSVLTSWLRAEAHGRQGEMERTGFGQPGEGNVKENVIAIYNYLMGQQREDRARLKRAQRKDRRQQTQVEVQEIPVRYHRKCFHYEDGQTLDQVAQRGYGIPILGDIQNLTGQSLIYLS